MDGRYDELIEETSQNLAEGLLTDIEYVIGVGEELDGFVLDRLRAVGRSVMSRLFEALGSHLIELLTSSTLRVERRPKVTYRTVFGEVEVESPYLL